MRVIQGVLTRRPGFLPRASRWLFLGPSLLSWRPIRSRHCCEEPERVLLWIVTARRLKKLQRVAYIFVGVLIQFSPWEGSSNPLSGIRSLLHLSSTFSNATKIRKPVRPRGGQGIRPRTLRTGVIYTQRITHLYKQVAGVSRSLQILISTLNLTSSQLTYLENNI